MNWCHSGLHDILKAILVEKRGTLSPMIIMIDNKDSFTYNLVDYIRDLGYSIQVISNNEMTADEVAGLNPEAICLSPGPGSPEDAGICLEVVKVLKGNIPILGVCLGHQAIIQAFGGKIVKAEQPMHGKRSAIRHDGRTLFSGLSHPVHVTRYHSLIAEASMIPADLEISATTESGEIMAVRHREWLIEGVQFHPEAILTDHGKIMLDQCFKHFGLLPKLRSGYNE